MKKKIKIAIFLTLFVIVFFSFLVFKNNENTENNISSIKLKILDSNMNHVDVHDISINSEEVLEKVYISNHKTRSQILSDDIHNEVVIIINKNSETSKEIGNYYSVKRNIPKENICVIYASTTEVIQRDEYNETEDVIQQFFIDNDLIETTKYIVTTKGVPLKIYGTGVSPFDYYGNCSSVDSELALIFSPMESGNDGKYNNPYFQEDDHFARNDNDGIYLVNRLTGFNVDDAKALVDRAISSENNLSGKAFFDADSGMSSGYKWYDELINESFYYVNDNYNFDSGLEESNKDIGLNGAKYNVYSSTNLTPANETAKDALLYWGWYSNSSYYDSFEWKPGALGQRLHSFNAKSFNSNSWCAGAVADGITGTQGNVYEPFLDAAHYPNIFFDRILDGYNFAEASYMARPYLSWQSVVVGDPLYTPFWFSVNLTCEDNENFVEPNQTTNYTLNIRNDGNLENEIEITKDNIPKDWIVELNLTNIVLKKGQSVDIKLSISVPLDVKRGIIEIIVTATSKKDSSKISKISTFTNVHHVLEFINITPLFHEMNADDELQFIATGYDEEWNEISIAPIWSVEGGGTINETGFFNASKVGEWKIYANYLDIEGNTKVNVSHGRVAEISLTPSDITFKTDDEEFFTARARDNDGNYWNITEQCEWTVNDPNGTISNGFYNPGKPGNWTISALYESIIGYSNITVEIGELSYIIVEPNGITITNDDSIQFIAKGYDSDGNEIPITPEWSYIGAGIIDGNGFFEANWAGNLTMIAYSGGKKGTAEITIIHGELKYINILPKIEKLNIGDTVQFEAFGYDSDMDFVDVTPNWDINGGGEIDNDGKFTATIPGNWTIYSNHSGISGHLNITVLPENDNPIDNLDKTPPEVIKILPKDNSENIPIDTKITIKFSEKMDFNSIEKAVNVFPEITFSLQNNDNENSTMLIFSSNLDYNKIYTITIKTIAEDLSGNQLENDFISSFETEKLGNIEGKIIDENGNPIIGAFVYIDGTEINTTTNSEGIYIIENVQKGNYQLKIQVANYSINQSIIVTAGNTTYVADIVFQETLQNDESNEKDNIFFIIIFIGVFIAVIVILLIFVFKNKNMKME